MFHIEVRLRINVAPEITKFFDVISAFYIKVHVYFNRWDYQLEKVVIFVKNWTKKLQNPFLIKTQASRHWSDL